MGVGTGDFPSDAVNREDARNLSVFAGEVMADVLGNFPWEWERMSFDVAEFERTVGLAAAEQGVGLRRAAEQLGLTRCS